MTKWEASAEPGLAHVSEGEATWVVAAHLACELEAEDKMMKMPKTCTCLGYGGCGSLSFHIGEV